MSIASGGRDLLRASGGNDCCRFWRLSPSFRSRLRIVGDFDWQDLNAQAGQLPTRTEYLLTQFNVIRTYLRLLVWPTGQSVDWYYPLSKSLFELPTLLSLALHCAPGFDGDNFSQENAALFIRSSFLLSGSRG